MIDLANIPNKCIVFCFEHHNSLGQVRALGKNGLKPILVVLKDKVHITSKSKYVNEKYIVKSVEEGYELIINRWGNEEEKPFIFTSDDIITSFLDKKFNSLKDKFFFNNCGAEGEITKNMDKSYMFEIASKIGFNVAQTFLWDRKKEIPKFKYPVITKTRDSLKNNWKGNSHIFNNENELKSFLLNIDDDKIMIQEFIAKKNELCLQCLSYNNGEDVFVALGINFKFQLSGKYASYINCFNFNDEKLIEKVKKIIKYFKYDGVFEIEFLEDENGEYYFLEINFRNSSWGYATTMTGMSTTLGWILSKLEGQDYRPQIKKADEGFTAMSEITDFKTRVLGKQIKYKDWKKQFKSCNFTYYYDKEDKAPFRHAIFGKFFKKLLLRK